jgi:hypothetical protein
LRLFLDIGALCPQGGSLPYAEILFRMDKDMGPNKRGHMKIVKSNNCQFSILQIFFHSMAAENSSFLWKGKIFLRKSISNF